MGAKTEYSEINQHKYISEEDVMYNDDYIIEYLFTPSTKYFKSKWIYYNFVWSQSTKMDVVNNPKYFNGNWAMVIRFYKYDTILYGTNSDKVRVTIFSLCDDEKSKTTQVYSI